MNVNMIRTFHQIDPKKYQSRVKEALQNTQDQMNALVEWKNKRLFLLPFDELNETEKKILFNDNELQKQVREYQNLSSQLSELQKLSSLRDKLDGTDYIWEAERRTIESGKAAKEAIASRANALWAAAVANAGKAWLSSNQSLKSLANLTENVFSQQQQIEQQTQAQLSWLAANKAQLAQQRAAMMNQQLLAEKQARDQVAMQKELMDYQKELSRWSSRSYWWWMPKYSTNTNSAAMNALETQANIKNTWTTDETKKRKWSLLNIMQDYQQWIKTKNNLNKLLNW